MNKTEGYSETAMVYSTCQAKLEYGEYVSPSLD